MMAVQAICTRCWNARSPEHPCPAHVRDDAGNVDPERCRDCGHQTTAGIYIRGIGVIEWKRCACSRLVWSALWVYPHDSCPDCAERLDGIADNHRAFMRELDRDRLLEHAAVD